MDEEIACTITEVEGMLGLAQGTIARYVRLGLICREVRALLWKRGRSWQIRPEDVWQLAAEVDRLRLEPPGAVSCTEAARVLSRLTGRQVKKSSITALIRQDRLELVPAGHRRVRVSLGSIQRLARDADWRDRREARERGVPLKVLRGGRS